MDKIIHNTFFNADMLAGLLFLGMGIFIKHFPPVSKKTIYGYRTQMSMKNNDTWREANLYAAFLSRKISFYLLAIGIICGLLFKTQSQLFFLITCGCVIIAAMILYGTTEWRLSNIFDEDGTRRGKPQTIFHPPDKHGL